MGMIITVGLLGYMVYLLLYIRKILNEIKKNKE